MEELQLALTTARVEQRNFGLWINNWQIGQTLNALVTNQLPSGELVLRVGGQQITATSDIPIQQGANLMLEVKQLTPVPTLRVITPPTSPAAASVGGTLQLLPASGDGIATQPLGSVAQGLQANAAASSLPASLLSSVDELLRQVTRSDRLSQPEGLANAVRDSGLFFESGLRAEARGRPSNAGGDFKAGLFRALGRVDAALSQVEALAMPAADVEALLEMKRDLESGLGRITLHQLNSQPADAQGARSWQLEIPVQHSGTYHSLRVDIEEERGERSGPDEEDDSPRWKVRLAVAPPALGEIEVALQLRGDQLGLRLGAVREDVRGLLEANMPRLERALASRGITMSSGGVTLLTRATSGPAEDRPGAGSGLDLRA